MKVTIVGIKPTRFTPKDSEREINGQSVYFEYTDRNTIGVATDKCFLSASRMLEVIPDMPCDASISYNKYGKVEDIFLER